MYIYLLRIVAVAAVLFLPFKAHAGLQTSIFLDDQTVNRGYTVVNADAQISIAVLPDVLSQGARVSIFNDNDTELALPQNKRKVSNAYTYTVDGGEHTVLKQPLLVDIAYYKDTGNTPGIYYFDTLKERWVWLPTERSENGDRLRAWIPFPHARIVALEDIEQTTKELQHQLSSSGAAVLDAESGGILFGKSPHQLHGMASITKLMTAMLALDSQTDWEQKIEILSVDQVGGSSAPLRTGEQVSMRDLFYSMLVPSANNSAHAISRVVSGNTYNFVRKMNKQAHKLGLNSTRFRDPSGLSAGNLSTPYEIARLTQAALEKPEILNATSQPEYNLYSIAANKKILKNTNRLLNDHTTTIIAGKTGHTYAAGYNVTVKAITNSGRGVIISVVGAPTRQASFDDVLHLVNNIR